MIRRRSGYGPTIATIETTGGTGDDGADESAPRAIRATLVERHGATPRVLEVGAAWGWRFLVVAAAVIALGWLLSRLRVVILPVFIALILAALLMPLIDALARRLPRVAAVTVVLASTVGAIVGVLVLMEAPVRSAIDDLRTSWRTARSDIRAWLQDGPLGLSQTQVDDISQRIDEFGRTLTTGLFDNAGSAARMAAEVFGGLVLTLVLLFFFAKEGRSMWQWLLRRVDPARRDAIDAGGGAAFVALQGWIRGVALTGVVDALLIGAALVILDVPAAVPLAIVTFFGAFLPIVGATVAGGLAAAIALAAQGPRTAVIVAVVVLLVQQIEGNVLLPMIMRRQVSLHPVVVLLALALGAAIGGIFGAIVAVPVTAALTAAAAAARRVEPVDTSALVLPGDLGTVDDVLK